MIAMISALFGFLGPFVPKVFDYFQAKQDHQQEIELMRLRMESAASEHLWRLEEINAQADIAEAVAVHKPEESYADKLISSVGGGALPAWVRAYVALIGVHVDFVIRMCRPLITYLMVGFYMFYKVAVFRALEASGMSGSDAFLESWAEFDQAMLAAVISFWFGGRVLQRHWKAK
ncbi:hypothetical protein I5S53_12095 [Pseudomonas juntendi]|uniref:hypothetical protein n=1 Tax=Pseudomonas juntendi TaxID=2666183 RepID=UPI0018D7280C|nr:hypothetical protein [Pseudomonas juntendi]MBH3384702.1 hypothetical protein [Pseudomonas juntendi]MDG9921021.1 hypothetical protein [Pseudomonas juntendi]MDH0509527.1 hypothetical protein [Pseudomonas juntendi]MDH1046656.1 hypothetical protein [Pseudomonas juntendi]